MNTVDDVAERLRVSRWTIYRLVKAKEIGCVRVGAAIRITEEQIRAFVRARRVPRKETNGDGQS